MKTRIPVRGGFYALADRHWSHQDLLNMISLPSETGATKTELSLMQAPGPRPFCEFDDGAIRGLRNVEGKLFAVAGTQLYQISASGIAIPRGVIPGVGRVSMAHNQFGTANQLVIDNGSARYVYNTVTLVLEKVTDESFPGSFCAFYVDQYLGFVEPQGRYWGHSDLADALDYNSLDTYEAEADPDRIISAYVSHREVLIFGKDTIEPFVNAPSGDGTAPFVRASNTVIECGCAARFSVAGMDNSVFWLDDKRIVRRLDGYTPVRISNAGIEQALAECTPGDISRAYAFTYEDQGFKVYYLTVPGQFTFGFDLRTQEWHRRSSPGRDDWRINELVFWEGQWVGGDRSSGRLYILDWNYSFDGTEELVREWVSGSLFADQRRIEVNEIEVLASVGAPTEAVGSFPAQPDPPTITGDAPSGVIGSAYSYAYTLADGTPPYAVTLRSGTLPAGLALSSAGVLSGAPTTIGAHEWTVRVTDANGLWDELDDEAVVVSAIPVLLTNLTPYFGLRSALELAATPVGWTISPTAVSLSKSGIYAIGSEHQDVSAPFFQIRKFDAATETWSAVTNPATMPAKGPLSMVWNHDDSAVLVLDTAFSASNWLIYTRVGDVFTKVADPGSFMDAGARTGDWDMEGERFVITNANTGNVLGVYPFVSGAIGSRFDGLNVGSGEQAVNPKFRPRALTDYVALVTATRVIVVDVSANPPTIAAQIAGLAGGGLAWSADGNYLIGVDNSTGGAKSVSLWEFDDTPGMEALTFIGNSVDQTSGTPSSSVLSPDGAYLAVIRSSGGSSYPPDIFHISEDAPPVATKMPAIASIGTPLFSVSWSGVTNE